MLSRRRFLAQSTTTLAAAGGLTHVHQVFANGSPNPAAPASGAKTQPKPGEPGILWFNVAEWGVEGRGWPNDEVLRYYDRLPAKAHGVVRDAVWNLSRDSSGMLTRFETDASEIHVRYTLYRERIELAHMPATGVSGIDLYGEDDRGDWRWISVFRPGSGNTGSPLLQAGKLVDRLMPAKRRYTAYLPLYNGIDSLEIGVPEDAFFNSIAPREDKPIVFYGTSITHGACASRPGMPHPAILGRWLNRPIINLGFSGNGMMEPEVGALLCELDPAVYVIDCLPNMEHKLVAERTEPLVRQLRAARPGTPIVLVEDRTYGYAWVRDYAKVRHEKSRAELRKAFDNLTKSGVQKLHYLEGADLLGDDGEATTDGSHPNDLGFMRQAQAFRPVLEKAL